MLIVDLHLIFVSNLTLVDAGEALCEGRADVFEGVGRLARRWNPHSEKFEVLLICGWDGLIVEDEANRLETTTL